VIFSRRRQEAPDPAYLFPSVLKFLWKGNRIYAHSFSKKWAGAEKIDSEFFDTGYVI
jgi:hypothetical protein